MKEFKNCLKDEIKKLLKNDFKKFQNINVV